MPMTELDEVDRAIIAILRSDLRRSNTAIAREVGVSEATVRRRLSHLVATGQLDWHMKTQAQKPANEVIVEVEIDERQALDVAGVLMAQECIRRVDRAIGPPVLLVRIAFHSTADLVKVLTEVIEPLDGVRSVRGVTLLHTLSQGQDEAEDILPEKALFVNEEADEAVARWALTAAQACFRANRIAVFEHVETAQPPIRVWASVGLSHSYLDTILRNPERGMLVHLLSAREPEFVEDAPNDPRMRFIHEAVRTEGYHAVLFVPLLIGDTLRGMLGLYHDAPRVYDADERALAQAFAAYLVQQMVT